MKPRTKIFLVFVFVVLVGTILFLAGALKGLTSTGLPGRMILVLDVRKPIPEAATTSPIARLLEPDTKTLQQLERILAGAAEDSAVEGCLLLVGPSMLGWARTSELRSALENFRDSGKPLLAYMEFGTNREIFLASVADEIVLAPAGYLFMGFAAQGAYLSRMLQMLYIEPEFERVGNYKSAVEMFTREGMSEPDREQLEALLDSLIEVYLGEVEQARGLSRENLQEAMDRSFLSASVALEMGLVDRLGYRDEVVSALTGNNKAIQLVGTNRYWDGRGLGSGPAFARDTLALIYAEGMIYPGESETGPFGSDGIGSDTLTRYLRTAGEDDSIRAVILRVNSPGGSGLASDVIWREVERIQEKGKPVFVSFGDVAASGGYYIAMGATKIFAQPTTLTGSIGVFAGKFNMGRLFDRIGLDLDGVERGKNVDMFSSARGFSEEQREILQEDLQSFYNRFVEYAAAGRGLTAEQLEEAAQGRIWSGSDALKIGLVDSLGGLTDTIRAAKTHLGIPLERSVRLRVFPEPAGFLDLFREKREIRIEEQLPASISGPLVLARRLEKLSIDPVWALWMPGLEMDSVQQGR